MNERIIELAKHAGFENGHQDRNGNSLSDELEKFARLIIEECISACATDKLDKTVGVEELIKQRIGMK